MVLCSSVIILLSEGNHSIIPTFILLHFSEYPGFQVPFFLVFFSVYTVTAVGNLGMIIIIKINSKLHMIMYFSLSHLSFINFFFCCSYIQTVGEFDCGGQNHFFLWLICAILSRLPIWCSRNVHVSSNGL